MFREQCSKRVHFIRALCSHFGSNSLYSLCTPILGTSLFWWLQCIWICVYVASGVWVTPLLLSFSTPHSPLLIFRSIMTSVQVNCTSVALLTQEGACTLSGLSYSGPSEEELARNRHTFPQAANNPSETATSQVQTGSSTSSKGAEPVGNAAAAGKSTAGAGAKRTGSAITQADMSPRLHVLERETGWEVRAQRSRSALLCSSLLFSRQVISYNTPTQTRFVRIRNGLSSTRCSERFASGYLLCLLCRATVL